ncbi:monovalent cation/H+ antiporter complex subunit F [Desulfurococcus mucosus]|uniref:Multiple resistance and pH regulation protein F n=1 Tax=Desulfurococcus mucosus (strain ATCC 35584 / DSM 2162 / JCM 9187 / O7/1) TaxID=765177 RepID=E8R9E2_DESM0|nr:monovalent cation/H+ antiporter complex subunit F [Desulfurococcus mucosus]ADV65118.1 multiple resistance and pH regulation protein F [Desulfurococcus mucosus DSM 2162]
MIVDIVVPVTILVYALSIIIVFVRALKGPTIGDQVLAIDVMTYATVTLMVLIAIYLREAILVVVAIPLALWVYALDIYVAKYLEKKEMGG